MAVQTFAMRDLVVSIDGQDVSGALQNLSDAVSISFQPMITYVNSTDGTGCFQQSSSNTCTLKIKMLSTHSINNDLAILYASLNSGVPVTGTAIAISYNGGGFIVAGDFALTGMFEQTMGTEIAAREWEFIGGGTMFPAALGKSS
jgi:hypothetical protein